MNDDSKDHIDSGSRLALGGSLLGGFGAFIGASCCVLPLILFNLGVSSAVIAQLGFFARYKDVFFLCALALLVVGVAVAFYKGRRPTRLVAIIFIGAAVLICASYFLPMYEPELLRLFGFRE